MTREATLKAWEVRREKYGPNGFSTQPCQPYAERRKLVLDKIREYEIRIEGMREGLRMMDEENNYFDLMTQPTREG